MHEIWKPMNLWPGYEVSDMGRIKSLERTMIRSNGRRHTTPERILKASLDTKGYLQFHPYRDGKRFHVPVHREVFSAFYRLRMADEDIHHRDHDKTNNRVENLQACTRTEHAEITRQHQYDAAYEAGYAQALIDLRGVH